MKMKRLSIVAVMLIMIVVASAGCSSKPKVGSQVSFSSVFSTNYKWVEYQATSILWGDSKIRIDKSTATYLGSPAVHEKFAYNMYSKSIEGDIYLDKSMMSFLGGTVNLPDDNGDIKTSDIHRNELGIIPYLGQTVFFTDYCNYTTLTYNGTESVTVPAGTYSNADSYTLSYWGEPYTYSMEPSIPVPVKIQTRGITLSLIGWV